MCIVSGYVAVLSLSLLFSLILKCAQWIIHFGFLFQCIYREEGTMFCWNLKKINVSTPVHQQQQQKTEKRMSKQSNVTVKKMNNIRTANIFEASNGSKQRRQKKTVENLCVFYSVKLYEILFLFFRWKSMSSQSQVNINGDQGKTREE